MVAGVLGLTGISGFLCYFVIMLLASAGLVAKTGFNVFKYFDSWQRVTIDGVTQGFMVSVLQNAQSTVDNSLLGFTGS